MDELVKESERGQPIHPFSPALRRFKIVPLIIEDADGSETSVAVDDLEEEKKGLFQRLSAMIGVDITSITIPISYSEPISFLMRLAENIQYYSLLDEAAHEKDPLKRLLMVSVFSLSPYSSGVRTRKPLNPCLGETFSFQTGSLKFVAEQVSHHPPIGAQYAENENFKFEAYMKVKTKFGGNSIDVMPLAWYKVTLKTTGESFSFNQATSTAHNVVVGRMWIDHFGKMQVTNEATGDHADLTLSKCGFMGRNWHEFKGVVFTKQGVAKHLLAGKWNEEIKAAPCAPADAAHFKPFSYPPSNQEEDAGNHEDEDYSDKELRGQSQAYSRVLKTGKQVWRPVEINTGKNLNKWEFTRFVYELMAMDKELAAKLPPTDSRKRPDRMALERGDLKAGSKFKREIEERQRHERKLRKRANETWTPRYFKRNEDPNDLNEWIYLGAYFQQLDAGELAMDE